MAQLVAERMGTTSVTPEREAFLHKMAEIERADGNQTLRHALLADALREALFAMANERKRLVAALVEAELHKSQAAVATNIIAETRKVLDTENDYLPDSVERLLTESKKLADAVVETCRKQMKENT